MATPDAIFQILSGYRLSAALRAAVELGIFDALARGPETAAGLGKRIGAAERGVRILLDSLLPTRLVAKKSGRYSASPLAHRFLVKGKREYVGSLIHLHGHPLIWNSFSRLAEAVRKGGTVLPSNAHSPRQEFWEDFAEATHEQARIQAESLLRIVPLGGPARILDVACGSGMYGLAFAEAYPEAEVVLQDRANVLRHTRRGVARSPAASRVGFLEGDLFQVDLGGPYDLLIASQILHHFSLADCDRLVKKFARALRPGGRLAVQEQIVDDARALRARQLLFSLVMLVWTNEGESYSFREIRRLLASNRFTNVRFSGLDQPSQFVIAERSRSRTSISR